MRISFSQNIKTIANQNVFPVFCIKQIKSSAEDDGLSLGFIHFIANYIFSPPHFHFHNHDDGDNPQCAAVAACPL